MTAPQQLVQKLWNYCNILPPSPRLRWTGRDDGLSFRLRRASARQDGDYVEQLTFLLFLKMADETARPPGLNLTALSRQL